MHWFRPLSVLFGTLVDLLALAIVGLILSLLITPTHRKSLEYDPSVNGTLPVYIIILLIQTCLFSTSFLGYYVAYINWRNNYQMDHGVRQKFMTWIFLWVTFCILAMAVAIYAIVRGKEPQEEMALLNEVFTKYSQDKVFVEHFERYQRENTCCGIYGPDDWFLVQFRSAGGSGGGGGGGFQSMDYGFRQNPSTGGCHFTLPTIPNGCGRRILEAVHVQLATYAGLMIIQTIVGLAAAGFAAYAFFYWLEKEVIVIPEDEVSNLIIIEPESSTSTFEGGSGEGFLQSGYYGDGVYPPPPTPGEGSFFQGDIQHSIVSSSSRGQPSSVKKLEESKTSKGSSKKGPSEDGTVVGGNNNPTLVIPPDASQLQQQQVTSTSPSVVTPQLVVNTPQPQPPLTIFPLTIAGGATAPPVGTTQALLSAAGPFDAGSRLLPGSIRPSRNGYYMPPPGGPYMAPGGAQYMSPGSFRPGSYQHAPLASVASRPKSKNHFIHEQERALGGKVLGELHIDHKKDPDNLEIGEAAGTGKHAHHATLAIVRNKNAPKPKKFFTETLKSSGKGHHGQTGHLAEDIAEMTGNADIIKHKVDDVVLPVEHPGAPVPPGGYLKALNKRRKKEAEEEKATMNMTGSGSVSGFDAQNILSGFLEPVPEPEKKVKEPSELIVPHTATMAPIVQPTTGSQAGSQVAAAAGSAVVDPNNHYLNAPVGSNQGGYLGAHHAEQQHGHYLGAGSHQNAHYMGSRGNAHYLGSHERAHYIETGYYGQHSRGNYLGGEHGHAHYIGGGQHSRTHYLGEHSRAHYLGGSATGRHSRAHYLDEHGHGQHSRAHYLGGEHGHAHYLGEHGQHSRAHYLGGEHNNGHHGQHSRAHYLGGEHGHGQHSRAHYLGEQGHHGQHSRAHYLGGEHGRAHYLGEHHNGQHSKAHYLGGEHGHAHYLGERGQHSRAHYVGSREQYGGHHQQEHHNNNHGGEHGRAHYLDHNRDHHATGQHNHAHYLGGGNHHNNDHGQHHHQGEHHHDGHHHKDKQSRYSNKILALRDKERSRSNKSSIKTGFLGGGRSQNIYKHHHAHDKDKASNYHKWSKSVQTVLLYMNPRPWTEEDV